MAPQTRTRQWIRRKWLHAEGAIETAQAHLLDVRGHYVDNYPQHLELVDANLTILEQVKGFLREARSKV